jgi:hypothetical protein
MYAIMSCNLSKNPLLHCRGGQYWTVGPREMRSRHACLCQTYPIGAYFPIGTLLAEVESSEKQKGELG